MSVGREPVVAVDFFVVGRVGRGEVFMAAAEIVGDGFAVDENDLEVLLVDPDLALEVALAFFEFFGAGLEDVGVEVVDLLAAEVGDVVLGEVGGLEDEGETVGDVVEVGLGHHDAFEGVARSEDDVFGAGAAVGEDDVGDLLVGAVGPCLCLREGVDADGLAEGVLVARFGELGFTGGKFGDDLFGRVVFGGSGIYGAESRRDLKIGARGRLDLGHAAEHGRKGPIAPEWRKGEAAGSDEVSG